jgi:NADH-quinone oxidoreductase subunit J
MEQVMFWLCGIIAIIFSLMMIIKRNPVHSALCLVMVFVMLAVLYVLLGAEFLAAVQVIVYAGAIMVLFLFVIMLLNLEEEVQRQGKARLALKTSSIVGAGLLLLFLFSGGVFRAVSAMGAAGQAAAETTSNTHAIAELLFTKYLLPFEVTSVLLLAAIVGAIVLAGKKG